VSRGEMPQPPLHPITRNSVPHSTTDHKSHTRPIIQWASMNHQRGPTYAYATPGDLPEVLRAPHSQRSRQHALNRPASCRQARAALTTAARNDGAARAGPHPQTKTMGTAAAPIARLERALAHGRTPTSSECSTNRVRC
jgi:hypothetical protein